MTAYLIDTKQKMSDAVYEILSHPQISHDTETKGPDNVPDISGLYPFHGARSFAHIIGTPKDQFYFDFNWTGMPKKLAPMMQPIFDDPKRLIYYVNAGFDQAISYFDGIEIKSRIADCASLARVEYNLHRSERPGDESFLSMDYLAEYYGVTRKLDIVKEYIKENNLYGEKCRFKGDRIMLFEKVPLDIMFEYGCGDARTTLDLGQKIVSCINYKDEFYLNQTGIERPSMLSVAQREIKLASTLFDMKKNGVRIWTGYTQEAIKHEEKISVDLQKELALEFGEFSISKGKDVANVLIKNGVDVPKNPLTKKGEELVAKLKGEIAEGQRALLNDALNEKERKKLSQDIAKKQNSLAKKLDLNYKTDKVTLEKIIKENEHLESLRKITEAKEADKKISTYYSNFLLLKDPEEILHADINANTTVTGRTSSSGPNLQNLNKHFVEINSYSFAVRKSICAATLGFNLIMADYEQQEMIVMLDQAGELGIIEKLKSGEYADFYLATAALLKEVLGIEISRQAAKAMALGLAYGKGLLLLAKELGFIGSNPTDEEIEQGKEKVKAFKEQFFQALPKLKELIKRLEEEVRRYGRIHTAFGRVIYLDQDKAYKALNAFVQGTCADISKQAMINCNDRLKAENMKTRMLLMVHDELIFETPFEDEALKARQIITEEMTRAYKGKHFSLQVGWDKSEINNDGFSSWGEKETWDLAS